MANNNLFKAESIAPRTWQITYAFADAGKYIKAYTYLLEGDDYALVIDTMYGYGNLRAFCETLTDKPMKVINTHYHGDHTAGNFHFDEAYIHWRDLPYFYEKSGMSPGSVEELYERAKSIAYPEYEQELDIRDFKVMEPMILYTVDDGDIFDLGGRQVQVIDVGGHTPGCIALLDRNCRFLYTGDCCNSNTLLGGRINGLSVEEYLENLLHLNSFCSEFDITYAGHEVLPICVITEGIELCARILAGTDDKVTYNDFNRPMVYGAKRSTTGGYREDGKIFNMSYLPEKLLKSPAGVRVIK